MDIWITMLKKLFNFKQPNNTNSQQHYSILNPQTETPQWFPKNYAYFSEEAYKKNIIVYKCVKEITKGLSLITPVIKRNGQRVTNHPFEQLLNKPNPYQTRNDFIENLATNFLLTGNAFIQANRGLNNKKPIELWNLRTDRMSINPDANGLVESYTYEINQQQLNWKVNPLNQQCNVLHIKEYDPNDDFYGMSPIEPASSSINQHNQALAWNQTLIQNGARPSGMLIFETPPHENERKRIEDIFKHQYQGKQNNGKVMIFGGKVEWKETGLSPKDMDFNNLRKTSSRDICHAFGVPPILVVEGESTYNNRIEARLELWEQTILPLFNKFSLNLCNWLNPMYQDNFTLTPDTSTNATLIPRKIEHRNQVIKEYQAGLINLEEARRLLEQDQPL